MFMEDKKLERVLFYASLVLVFAGYVSIFMLTDLLNKLSYLVLFVVVFEVLFFALEGKRKKLIRRMKVEYDKSEQSQEQKKLMMYSRIALFAGFFTIPAYIRERSPIFMLLSALFMILAMVLNDKVQRLYPLAGKQGRKRGKKKREH